MMRTTSIYENGSYLGCHPTLHAEDARWKFSKLKPFLDHYATLAPRLQVRILDVGGGSGHLLHEVSEYLYARHGLQVIPYALDVSREMLTIQAHNNPDIRDTFHEDICNCSLGDKSVDLTLAIDVLEHIPEVVLALQNIRRISRHLLLKCPLESNAYSTFYNLIKRGAPRRAAATTIGHVHFFTCSRLRSLVEQHCGEILRESFTNVFSYYRSGSSFRALPRIDRILYSLANALHRLSPRAAASLCTDFLVLLIECDSSAGEQFARPHRR